VTFNALLQLVATALGSWGADVRQEDLSLETGLDKSAVAHAVKHLVQFGDVE
jgi:hypothetical protein